MQARNGAWAQGVGRNPGRVTVAAVVYYYRGLMYQRVNSHAAGVKPDFEVNAVRRLRASFCSPCGVESAGSGVSGWFGETHRTAVMGTSVVLIGARRVVRCTNDTAPAIVGRRRNHRTLVHRSNLRRSNRRPGGHPDASGHATNTRYRGLTNSLIAKRFRSSGSDRMNCMVAVSARLMHISVAHSVNNISGA